MIAAARTTPSPVTWGADEEGFLAVPPFRHPTSRRDEPKKHAMAEEDVEFLFQAVAHDLRSPLATLSLFVQLVSEHHGIALGPDGRGMLGAMKQSLEAMERIITGYIEFVRNDFPLSANPRRVDMNDLARSIASEVLLTASHREVQFDIDDLPDAHGDRAMLRQVWVNLISNAVKFSRSKPVVKIKIAAARRAGTVSYRISDNGIGFNPADAEGLFSPFRRLTSGAGIAGLGLGLSLVRRIVERHGGEISAHSRPGEGATFTFDLPAVSSAAAHVRLEIVGED